MNFSPSPDTAATTFTTRFAFSRVPEENVTEALPRASVTTDDALICPANFPDSSTALKVTVTSLTAALLASKTVAVTIEVSELSLFTDIRDRDSEKDTAFSPVFRVISAVIF